MCRVGILEDLHINFKLEPQPPTNRPMNAFKGTILGFGYILKPFVKCLCNMLSKHLLHKLSSKKKC